MDVNERITFWIMFIKNRMKSMGLDAEKVFLNGNCGNFYKILKEIFSDKEVIPHRISHPKEGAMHIISEIKSGNESKFYDITGETDIIRYADLFNRLNPYRKYATDEFTEHVATDFEVRQQSDRYRYNEEFEQSEIDNQMKDLMTMIRKELEKQRNNPQISMYQK